MLLLGNSTGFSLYAKSIRGGDEEDETVQLNGLYKVNFPQIFECELNCASTPYGLKRLFS